MAESNKVLFIIEQYVCKEDHDPECWVPQLIYEHNNQTIVYDSEINVQKAVDRLNEESNAVFPLTEIEEFKLREQIEEIESKENISEGDEFDLEMLHYRLDTNTFSYWRYYVREAVTAEEAANSLVGHCT